MWDILIERLQAKDPLAFFYCMSLFQISVGFYSLYYQYRVRQWPWVWGSLDGMGVEVFSHDTIASERDYKAKVSYRYSVKGKEYEGHRLSAMIILANGNAAGVLQHQLKGVKKNRKGQVKVYYNPNRPKKSYLINGSLGQLAFTLLYIGVFIWVYSILNQRIFR